MNNQKTEENCCVECNKILIGRSDKKFCSIYCKSSYYYKVNRENENQTFIDVDKTLKLNRKILKNYNQAGKATIRKEDLINKGFNPKYFTNYWKNQKGDVYLFCYEYGFLEISEYGKSKYVLILWQDYMR